MVTACTYTVWFPISPVTASGTDESSATGQKLQAMEVELQGTEMEMTESDREEKVEAFIENITTALGKVSIPAFKSYLALSRGTTITYKEYDNNTCVVRLSTLLIVLVV